MESIKNALKSISDNHVFGEIGMRPEISVDSLAITPLLKALLNEYTGYLTEIHDEGVVKPDGQGGMTYIEKVSKLEGGRLIYNYVSDVYKQYIYIFDEAMIEVSINNGNYFSVKGFSANEKFLTDLQVSIKDLFLPAVQQGHVFAIVSSGSRLSLSSIGAAGIPLNKNNYTKTVTQGYEYIVQDLNSSHPSGRISILEGEPGTGKTHIIRALLLDVPHAMFVLVSPEMVSSLSGPELLPLLLAQKQSYGLKGPIILILEDADKCLVTRAADNVASIQALLNLGDGILGSLLDLRIVATTNAKKLEIEGAILRPGRLSKRIEVGPLDQKTAINVFKNLLPETPVSDKLNYNSYYTLAEVYSFARQSGWLPDDKEDIAAKSHLAVGYSDDDNYD